MRTLLLAIGLLLASLLTACGDNDDSVATDDDGRPTTTDTESAGSDADDETTTSTGAGAESGDDADSDDPADEPATGSDEQPADDDTGAASGDSGTVAIQLEQVEGIFIEGFEIGLRVETADGTTLSAALWSDVVEAGGVTSPDAYYDTVYEVSVPAGPVVVLATVNVGMGPPPETPDLAGDMDCKLPVEVPADGRVDVEVLFDGGRAGNCLRLVES